MYSINLVTNMCIIFTSNNVLKSGKPLSSGATQDRKEARSEEL